MSVDSSLNELREAVISKYNQAMARPGYNNPWEYVLESGIDPLGSFDEYTAGYSRMKPGLIITEKYSVVSPPSYVRDVAIDMSQASYVNGAAFGSVYRYWLDSKGSVTVIGSPSTYCAISNAARVLLPEKFDYTSYFLGNVERLKDGLYLSKTAGTISSNWAQRYDDSYTEIPVKCPVDADVPYHLNQISISAEDMVGIFNNMIDRSGESTTKYITLGGRNLNKLTDAQKNIALSKGWDLQ